MHGWLVRLKMLNQMVFRMINWVCCLTMVPYLSTVVFMSLARAEAEAVFALPDSASAWQQSLNGKWSFLYAKGGEDGSAKDFFRPTFDVSTWKTLTVPGNWELQGFSEPRYALELEEGLGFYRRDFSLPAEWHGRRVFLRFGGVAYGFTAWVNGKKIGSSRYSAYNPHTFDITDFIQQDGEQILAVRVTTRPLGWAFDVNDDWSLSGIYRDVTVFSLPPTYLSQLKTATTLQGDGSAEFSVTLKAEGEGGQVQGTLIAPNGDSMGDFALGKESQGVYSGKLLIKHPQLWTAETPTLYHLKIVFSQEGKLLQSADTRVGLREVSIHEGVLQLNGKPIKLRGINHHDLEPITGRAVSEHGMRRDLELIKAANINFIRTSHYPPDSRFLDLCDEKGFYVLDEVPIGKGENHLNDPKYRENIVGRVRPTIERDRNHASVIIWSIGNENPITDAELEAAKLAKTIDPTRPICIPKIGSYFEKNYAKLPDFVDIYTPHYPVNTTLKRFARKLKRPLILTEYAHALGLASDRIQDQWEIIQATPTFAGGSIWHFHDQGLLRHAETPVDASNPTPYVWVDSQNYYDTSGDQGADGIVYSDRTPQSDYREVRKVYAPVRIEPETCAVRPGAETISLNIENRYDFRSLEGMKLAWTLLRNGKGIQSGSGALTAKARATEKTEIPITIPDDAQYDVLALDLQCKDQVGRVITERSFQLKLDDAEPFAWRERLPLGEIKLTESGKAVKVDAPHWVLTIDRSTGKLNIRNASGRLIVSGISPHAGRSLTMAEALAAKKSGIWQNAATLSPASCKIETSHTAGASLSITVSGIYPRPVVSEVNDEIDRSNDPLFADHHYAGIAANTDEALVGGYQMDITANGSIHIRYDYVPRNASGYFSEAGLSIALPAKDAEFRWIGQGIDAGYPGKDRLNEFGIFHLNRHDIRFRGNRRATFVAMLTASDGVGVSMTCAPSDIAVECHGDTTLLSHNAIISGLGNKGVSPETRCSAAKTKHISGSFTLVPLGTEWPEALVRWFGNPAAATDILAPYFHSYDQ